MSVLCPISNCVQTDSNKTNNCATDCCSSQIHFVHQDFPKTFPILQTTSMFYNVSFLIANNQQISSDRTTHALYLLIFFYIQPTLVGLNKNYILLNQIIVNFTKFILANTSGTKNNNQISFGSIYILQIKLFTNSRFLASKSQKVFFLSTLLFHDMCQPLLTTLLY